MIMFHSSMIYISAKDSVKPNNVIALKIISSDCSVKRMIVEVYTC